MNALEAIMSRVSIRLFKEEEIPDDILKKVLTAGLRAPTAGGGEQWFFIVVKSRELRVKIHELLIKAHRMYGEKVVKGGLPKEVMDKWLRKMYEGQYLAPTYIAAYIDLRRRLYNDEFKELERLWAIQSLSAAIENMILAAWDLGLGSVWLGVPLLIKDEFNKLLNPPPNCELQAVIALGYPKYVPKQRPRKDLSEVVRFM